MEKPSERCLQRCSVSQPSSTTAVLVASQCQYWTGALVHANATYIRWLLSMIAVQANLAHVTVMTQMLL